MRYLIAALVSLAATASIAADYTGYPPSEVKGEARTGLMAQKICSIKWGADARHVTDAMKAEVFQREGYSGNDDHRCDNPKNPKRRCEIDHLISLSSGVPTLSPICGYSPMPALGTQVARTT
jgi:hypothetical protein